ncbi:MAG: lysophospholipid acyltransferase family protein [Campylobacterota bacterium]|nr:lysophospholipid acyltransferase family protein [Campylobacterota bacterium]
MEIKQRGSAFGYKILLLIYSIVGYRSVAFILNFVALYYLFFTPSVKKAMRSYYRHLGIEPTNRVYFNHIKMFALSIFDRFVSRINPEELKFDIHNLEALDLFEEGGIVLLSHVGSWATAAHCLQDGILSMHIVMRENTQENIYQVEQSNQRYNEQSVKIIDLNQGKMAANIQIANALINKEVVAMMADRAVDKMQVVEVDFFGSKVKMNKTPFEIAKRLNKPLVAIFVLNTGVKKYDLMFESIALGSITAMAQTYSDRLEKVLKKHPNQWYNFYDFFAGVK